MKLCTLAFAFIVTASSSACSRDQVRLGVGAAAVFRHAMPELVQAHRDATGVNVDVVYGASDRLVEQASAPGKLDVLVLADPSAFGGVNAGAPRPIATTTLVLIGPSGSAYRFANLKDEGVVAIGDPALVPAGRYAKRYLEQLGAWDLVSPRVVLGGDVAGTLSLAQRGTAHVAIVYATDAVDASPLVVLDRAADGPRIELAAATTAHASHAAEADGFVRFLSSSAARQVLSRHGFATP
jgi:molybdate transport system substrate-binding protein